MTAKATAQTHKYLALGKADKSTSQPSNSRPLRFASSSPSFSLSDCAPSEIWYWDHKRGYNLQDDYARKLKPIFDKRIDLEWHVKQIKADSLDKSSIDCFHSQ